MKHLNTFVIVAVALAALLFSAGCDEYDVVDFVTTGNIEDTDAEYYILCDNGKLQSYGPNSLVTTFKSAFTGLDCSVSTSAQGRPLTLRQFLTYESGNHPEANKNRLAAVGSPALVNTFPRLFPMLFNGKFPAATSNNVQPTCSATTGLYLVNHTNGTVTSMMACPFSITKVIPVRSHPLQLEFTPNGSTALVTSYDGAVTFIDTATNTVTFTLNLPTYNPSGIAISSDGTRAYVTHYLDIDPALLVIDIPNRKLLTTIPLPGLYPGVVALTPDGAQAWVNYYNGNYVTIVDTLTNTVSGTVNISAQVGSGMAFNPTGTRAFLAVYPSSLFVVDTATLAVLARIPVGALPNDVVVAPSGSYVAVTGGAQAGVWLVDAKTYKVLGKPSTPVTGFGSMGLAIIH